MVGYLYLVLFYLYSNLDGKNICCIVYIFYRAIFVPSNNIPYSVRGSSFNRPISDESTKSFGIEQQTTFVNKSRASDLNNRLHYVI